MALLDKDTMKLLEGKYLKWQDGVVRTLKIKSVEKVEREFPSGDKRTVTEFTVEDVDTNEEKTFSANKGFLKAIRPINDQLDIGSIIRVEPTAYTFQNREGQDVTAYDFNVQDATNDSQDFA